LTLALDGSEQSASHTGHFTPGVGTLSTHWTGDATFASKQKLSV